MNKTELDHITDFINSPAFAMMSEEVKSETYSKQKEPVVSNKTTKAPATGLCVWLRDGKFIQEYFAADTMIKAIQSVGCARVKSLGLTLDKENIILPHGNYPSPMAPHAAGN